LHYGCVPVVARVGGLADTIIDANDALRQVLPSGTIFASYAGSPNMLQRHRHATPTGGLAVTGWHESRCFMDLEASYADLLFPLKPLEMIKTVPTNNEGEASISGLAKSRRVPADPPRREFHSIDFL
jgi:hypothetical protein